KLRLDRDRAVFRQETGSLDGVFGEEVRRLAVERENSEALFTQLQTEGHHRTDRRAFNHRLGIGREAAFDGQVWDVYRGRVQEGGPTGARSRSTRNVRDRRHHLLIG